MRFKKSTISAIIILVSLATVVVMSGLNFLFETRNRNNAGDLEAGNSEIQSRKIDKMEKIFLKTKDNIKIAANLYTAEKPAGWLVLTHMMPAVKESWQGLAEEFANRGYESIAIDLRGHGESDGGPNGYKNFSDADHQKSILDLEAAVDYLAQNRKATSDKTVFIGASIGANLSLQYISEHPELKTAVLLSPGLDYRGIKTEPLIKNLKAGQRIFFVSAEDDGDNASENQKLYDLTPPAVQKQIQIYRNGGHGTNIFENQPELMNLVIKFIK